MAISSFSKLFQPSFLPKIPPFMLSTKTSLTTTSSNAEIIYTHLLKNVQNPENTLNSVITNSQLNAPLVSHVLHKCCSFNNPQLGLRFFIWAGVQPKYRFSHHMYSLACNVLELDKNPCRIRDLFEVYRVDGYNAVDVRLFRVVLNLCKVARIADQALWLLRKMEGFGCRPDSTVFNVVIRLLCEKGELDVAAGLMREMEESGLYPDMITFMSLVKGFCNAGCLEDACGFKVMRSYGCSPNFVAYSALLDGICRFGSFEKALELLGEMEKEGGECMPNVITYTSVIQSFCEKGKSIEALSVLDRMETRECSPNRVTIIVLINGLCAEGHMVEAYKLIDRIIGGGCVSAGECYSSLVISLLRIERIEEAEKVFRWMLDSSVRPDGLACSILLKGLCKEGNFLDAFNLYFDVENTGFVLTMDSDICSILLDGLQKQNYVIQMAKLTSLMDQKGIQIKAPYIHAIKEHLQGSTDISKLCKLKRGC